MLMAADAQEVTLLEMLDLSAAAFDCVNHTILSSVFKLELV